MAVRPDALIKQAGSLREGRRFDEREDIAHPGRLNDACRDSKHPWERGRLARQRTNKARLSAGETPAPAGGEREPLGYSIDSRSMREGDLFFAIKGENYDGHRFVQEVLRGGALAAVVTNEFLSELTARESKARPGCCRSRTRWQRFKRSPHRCAGRGLAAKSRSPEARVRPQQKN